MTTVLTRSPFVHTWLRDPWSQPAAAESLVPAADVYREGEDLVARLDLPGVDPADDITVEVEGRKLVVRGERKDQRSEESGDRKSVV